MALFTDFNTSFAVHPTKKDLSLQTDVDAVKQSIKNLVLTDKRERLFQPGIGCNIRRSLFENFSAHSVVVAKQSIVEVITNYEPRCNLIDVRASSDPENNIMFITIVFSVINSSTVEELNLALERIR